MSLQGGCTYASDENGATFTFTGGGVLAGGVRPLSGAGFLPLVAFQTVSSDFKAVADIYNVNGVQTAVAGGAVTPAYRLGTAALVGSHVADLLGNGGGRFHGL